MLSKFLKVDKEKQKLNKVQKILYGFATLEHIQFVPPKSPTEKYNVKSFNSCYE